MPVTHLPAALGPILDILDWAGNKALLICFAAAAYRR